MACQCFCIKWIADLNEWVDDFKPIPLLIIRTISALSLCTAFILLFLNMLSCAVIPTFDLVHRHVTVDKSIVTLHLGAFGYCLDEHCFPVSSKKYWIMPGTGFGISLITGIPLFYIHVSDSFTYSSFFLFVYLYIYYLSRMQTTLSRIFRTDCIRKT